MDVGTKIRQIRELKGLSQEFLAQKLNMSQGAYGKIERNQSEVSINRLEEIANILEVSLNQLLNFDEKNLFLNSTFNETGNIGTVHGNGIGTVNESDATRIEKLYEKLLLQKDAEIAVLKELLALYKPKGDTVN